MLHHGSHLATFGLSRLEEDLATSYLCKKFALVDSSKKKGDLESHDGKKISDIDFFSSKLARNNMRKKFKSKKQRKKNHVFQLKVIVIFLFISV